MSMFGSVDALKRGLDASSIRHNVTLDNLANVDTPDFKSSTVRFEDILRENLEAETDAFNNKQTRGKHIQFGFPEDNTPQIVLNDNFTVRMDGNNVDVEYEMAELAKNQIYYNTLVQKISAEFSRLRIAITEGR